MSVQSGFFARFIELTARALMASGTADPQKSAQTILDHFLLVEPGEQEKLLREAAALNDGQIKEIIDSQFLTAQRADADAPLPEAQQLLLNSLCDAGRDSGQPAEAVSRSLNAVLHSHGGGRVAPRSLQ